MKKLVSFIIFLIAAQFLIARQDSLKKTRIGNFRGLYTTIYYGYQGNSRFVFSRYLQTSDYDYAARNYKFKTPNLGVGYVLSHGAFFIRTDLSYCYGSKEINENYSGNNKDINGPTGLYEFNAQSIYFSGSLIGTQYYKFDDQIKGSLNLHYVDFGMVLGGNITRNFRLYSGWRIAYLAKSNYKVVQKRKADSYIITGHPSPTSVKDSFIETTQLEYKDKGIPFNSQILESQVYTTIGFCVNLNIKNRLFLIEGQYDYNGIFLLSQEFSQDYVLVKLSYVFKYSTYFGNKKTKD